MNLDRGGNIGRKLYVLALALALALASTAPAEDDEGGGVAKGSSLDPDLVKAKAEMLKAVAAKQEADVKAYLAESEKQLNFAKAAGEWAKARYLEELRGILVAEYNEIVTQQRRVQRLIEELRWNQALITHWRMGRTSQSSFNAMLKLVAGSLEFEPIRAALSKKVEPLPAENFIVNDDETGTASDLCEFPGGDVRRLLLFLRKKNFSLEPLEDAHFIVMEALSVISKSAADRILQHEQEIQAVRASRISELFQPPN